MIKPRTYRKFYRDVKLFEKNKDMILPIALVRQSVGEFGFWKKVYIFATVLFR